MILSLLIWYFIPLQLCSPHCTTCVYCLKHTCQIKEQLMHLIFNYCLLHHHAQWENVKASNLQCFKKQSVRCDHWALLHIHRHTDRNLNIEWGHLWACLCSVGFFTLPFVSKGKLACDGIACQKEKLKANVCFQYLEKKDKTSSIYYKKQMINYHTR